MPYGYDNPPACPRVRLAQAFAHVDKVVRELFGVRAAFESFDKPKSQFSVDAQHVFIAYNGVYVEGTPPHLPCGLYAGGLSYIEIAEHLGLAPSTVRTHLAAIYRKMGVSSKLELRDALGPSVLASGSADPQPPLREKPSIAVLAFENMSGDP